MVTVEQARPGVADERIAIEIRRQRAMQAIVLDELAERWKARRERLEKLAKRPGVDLESCRAGAFAWDAQKFNVHGVPEGQQPM